MDTVMLQDPHEYAPRLRTILSEAHRALQSCKLMVCKGHVHVPACLAELPEAPHLAIHLLLLSSEPGAMAGLASTKGLGSAISHRGLRRAAWAAPEAPGNLFLPWDTAAAGELADGGREALNRIGCGA
jgi:hypothetical protein